MINIIFLTAISWLNPVAPKDSLRTETINGKLFVIHQVGDKETLFSISRRYGATLAGVLEANPNADSGLEVGQLLKIPYVAKNKPQPQTVSGIHKVQPKETLFSISRQYNISVDDIKAWNYLKDNSLTVGQDLRIKRPASFTETKPSETVASSAAPKGAHVVAAGETLFSISRQHNVTVDQVKTWNNIQGNELKTGQVLVVVPPASAPAKTEPKTVVKTTEVKQAPAVTAPVVKEVKEEPKTVVVEPSIKISESVAGSDEIKEGGVAELIEGSEGNRKYLALHKNAKVGTIMKVRNELNNREVFVRVVGPLPETSVNDKLVIKISKSAYDRLGAIDPKFRVEVTYYK